MFEERGHMRVSLPTQVSSMRQLSAQYFKQVSTNMKEHLSRVHHDEPSPSHRSHQISRGSFLHTKHPLSCLVYACGSREGKISHPSEATRRLSKQNLPRRPNKVHAPTGRNIGKQKVSLVALTTYRPCSGMSIDDTCILVPLNASAKRKNIEICILFRHDDLL